MVGLIVNVSEDGEKVVVLGIVHSLVPSAYLRAQDAWLPLKTALAVTS